MPRPPPPRTAPHPPYFSLSLHAPKDCSAPTPLPNFPLCFRNRITFEIHFLLIQANRFPINHVGSVPSSGGLFGRAAGRGATAHNSTCALSWHRPVVATSGRWCLDPEGLFFPSKLSLPLAICLAVRNSLGGGCPPSTNLEAEPVEFLHTWWCSIVAKRLNCGSGRSQYESCPLQVSLIFSFS